jgi:hypothetical protein
LPTATMTNPIHDLSFTTITTVHGRYAEHVQQVHDMLYNSRRFTAATLQPLKRAIQQYRMHGEDFESAPILHVVTAPENYDPDTEVKTGGTVACGATLGDGRVVVVVAEPWQRKGVGRSVVFALREADFQATTHMAMHRDNIAGLAFAHAVGYRIESFDTYNEVVKLRRTWW